MKAYIVIPKIKIQNANALSSAYTIGFPAITAWLGAVHALQRQICQYPELRQISFIKMAVSCNYYNLQVYKGPGDFQSSIIGTSNPLRKKGSNFERPPFIEAPRIQLTVSLLIEVQGINAENQKNVIRMLQRKLPCMKMASGDILGFDKIQVFYIDKNQADTIKKVIMQLMPGYILIERRDLLQIIDIAQDGLDKLLAYLKVNFTAIQDTTGNIIGWKPKRLVSGWIVPIAVGFKRISEVGTVLNQRDMKCNHCFTENVVTLGEFKMAYRFNDIEDIMWQYTYEQDKGLYVCKNQNNF
jgi:CRISPR-associated protein Csy2